jgi:hypothetical protein
MCVFIAVARYTFFGVSKALITSSKKLSVTHDTIFESVLALVGAISTPSTL